MMMILGVLKKILKILINSNSQDFGKNVIFHKIDIIKILQYLISIKIIILSIIFKKVITN